MRPPPDRPPVIPPLQSAAVPVSRDGSLVISFRAFTEPVIGIVSLTAKLTNQAHRVRLATKPFQAEEALARDRVPSPHRRHQCPL